jgi:TPR repeat protein
MYVNGNGVAEDDVMAYLWWNLAAAQGAESAKEYKGILSKQMTKEQIAEAQKLSRDWLAKHQK